MTERTRGGESSEKPLRQRSKKTLTEQIVESSNKTVERKMEYEGNIGMIISTGSTLLDLEISGERVRGGGLPAGILVEIFSWPSYGKTVLLCEIAGNVQRPGGEVLFKDPEARLNKTFAKRFGLKPDEMDYSTPDTVPQVFEPIRKWKPKNPNVVNGIFADSLAALSTDLELDKDEGDRMGMRRAKEFSQECRKTCRLLTNNNYLMVCSNQLRATGAKMGKASDTTGGNAIPYYASLRIGLKGKEVLTRDIQIAVEGKDERIKLEERKFGTKVMAWIDKSSVGMDGGEVPLYILAHYGIDDVRANLQWYKETTKSTKYYAGGRGLEEACTMLERGGPEAVLAFREKVIDLWEEIRYLTVEKDKNRLEKVRW